MLKQKNHEDKIISEFLEAIGPWYRYLIIGGGFAPFVYKLYLADPKLKHVPIATHDLDIILPRKLPQHFSKDISAYLKVAGFEPIYKDREQPPTCSYIKELEGEELEIEFLTSLSRQRHNATIQGVIAQPLSYLEMSLKNTVAFQTYSKKPGLVVSPDAWIFHKGLTFMKRTNELKKLKDLYGIWYVATELGDFSVDACNKLNNLRQQQKKWNTTFEKNLRDWMSQATPVLWHQLEAQDPSGRLAKRHFEYLIINILNC